MVNADPLSLDNLDDYLAAETAAAEKQAGNRFFPAADLEGRAVPEREWLVPQLIPMQTVTLFSGDGGTGKSLLSLQLAAAVATGGKWLSQITRSGRAVFLTAEDDEAELHRRIDTIAHAEGCSLIDLDGLLLRSMAGQDALLAVMEGRSGALKTTALYEELTDYLKRTEPALVVLDTLADFYPANENDRAQVRQFIGLLRRLAIDCGCAVLLLSHPSLTGVSNGSGLSGSTAWNNSVRSRLYLERIIQDGYEANPNSRRLSTKKANYGPTGQEIAMRWQQGVFVADEPESGLDRMVASHKAERVFLKLLQQFTEQGRRVNANAGPNYAPKVMADHPDNEAISKRAFRTAMDTLFVAGKLKIVEDGPPSKRTTHIVAVK